MTRWWIHCKRVLDALAAICLLVILLPFALVLCLIGRPSLCRQPCVGLNETTFVLRTFLFPSTRVGRICGPFWMRAYPALLSVVSGHLSFVGPRPLPILGELPAADILKQRCRVRPGLLCRWWLRVRVNMTFDSEYSADLEYVANASPRTDLSLLLRAALAQLYGGTAASETQADSLQLLGVTISNTTMASVLDDVDRVIDERRPHRFFFVNADCLNLACRNTDYRAVLNRGDSVLADGIGVKIGARMTGQSVRQNVNGTDLFPRLCERLGKADRSLFLLGARPGVVDDVASWLALHYPTLRLAGTQHGYFEDHETDAVVERIRDAKADVLLVAFGAPRQELWIDRHLEQTGVPVAFGVGGLFDFYSGRIKRAPVWMREAGLEWVYRLIQEPRRMWKRYLVGNVVFVFRVWRRGQSAW